jgi:hypothetical protein
VNAQIRACIKIKDNAATKFERLLIIGKDIIKIETYNKYDSFLLYSTNRIDNSPPTNRVYMEYLDENNIELK